LAHELAHVAMHTGTENAVGCRGSAEIEAGKASPTSSATVPGPALRHLQLRLRRPLGRPATPKKIRNSADRVITTARGILRSVGLLSEAVAA